jgi:hypothetical protein
MNKIFKNVFLALALSIGLVATPVSAATMIVSPSNPQGWTTADTRTGGAVNYVADATSPFGDDALQLTTDATTTAKAQYMHEANVALSDITDLSYYTKQVSGPSYAAASYQVAVDLNGDETGGFTTLVYEPYQNGTVASGWQYWDVDAGDLWSSRSFTDGDCSVTAGAGGAPFYDIDDLADDCPDAVVIGFGVNIGSNNPSYNVYTDGVTFNGTTYDFEVANMPTSKDACKNGGYKNLQDADGNSFKNQGQCVSYFNHNS